MENISYDKPCNSNKDCDSNVCELIYENNKTKGRYCLMDSNNVFTKKCTNNKDCNSGMCKPIYDDNNTFITRKCVKAPKIDKDTSFNALFGTDRDNDYGLLNSNTIALHVGEKGPLTEIIIKIFSIIGNLFNIIIFNGDVCRSNIAKAKAGCSNSNIKINSLNHCLGERSSPCSTMTERPHQALIYGIFLDIFDIIFGGIMNNFKTKTTHTCSKNKKGINLWYIRVLLTILFPPLGVFMTFGIRGISKIIVCCILTMFFYFPGLIYALVVINTSKLEEEDSEIMTELKKIHKL